MAYNKLQTPSPSVVLPSVDAPGTTAYSKSHWDKRPQKYNEHTFRKVVVYVYMVITLNNLASFGLNQALKLFFMKLGWSNYGSNAMKATFDAVSAFSVMFGSYLADEYVGKWKMIFGAVTIDVIGMAMLVISSLPSIVNENVMLAKVLFNCGLFLAVCQVHMMMTQLVYSFGADQFSPDAPAWKKPFYFNGILWAVCLGVTISYALLPTVVTNGIGSIPREYGFTANFAFTLICVVLTVVIFTATRKRYVQLPPTKNSVSQVLRVLGRHACRNFKTALIIIAAAMYTIGFLANVLASFLDTGGVSQTVAKLGGLLIALATVIWVYIGRDPSFLDSAKDYAASEEDAEFVDSVKRFIRLLPLFAINAIWTMVQNQRGNNQTIIQQTDVRLHDKPDSAQIPAQTIMIMLPLSTLFFIPLCEKVIYPMYERIVGKPPSRFGRIAVGYFIGAICMFWSGCFEIIRRNAPLLTYVDAAGVTQFIRNKDGKQPMSSIAWYGAAPQLLINSFANTLIFGTVYDLAYTEVPQTLTASSFAIGLFSNAMGNTMLSVCVLLWRDYIPANLNNGNMEYLFFTYGVLMLLGLAAFLVVMRQLELGTIPKDYKKRDPETSEEEAGRV